MTNHYRRKSKWMGQREPKGVGVRWQKGERYFGCYRPNPTDMTLSPQKTDLNPLFESFASFPIQTSFPPSSILGSMTWTQLSSPAMTILRPSVLHENEWAYYQSLEIRNSLQGYSTGEERLWRQRGWGGRLISGGTVYARSIRFVCIFL